MSKKVSVSAGQSIYDIAIQEYGSIEGMASILELNPSIDLNTDLEIGQIILVEDSPINLDVIEYFTELGKKPATLDVSETGATNWILADGNWNDAKEWVDFEQWNDNI